MYRQREESIDDIIKNLKKNFTSIDIRLLLINKDNNWICNFAIIRLSNKDQQEIDNIHDDKLKIYVKKSSKADLIFFSKPIMSMNQILKELEEGRIKYRNKIFQIKDNKSLSRSSKVTEYRLYNDFWEYYSSISDDPNVQITLEKQIGKNVFGFDNYILNKIFDYDLNKYVCCVIKIPLYCLFY